MAQGSIAFFSLSHGRNCSVNKSISDTFSTKVTTKIHRVSFLFQKYQLLFSHFLGSGSTISESDVPSEIAITSFLALLHDVQFLVESLGQNLFLPGAGNNMGVQFHIVFCIYVYLA